MNTTDLIDLYTDFLLVSSYQATATGLSALLDNKISHDKITRLLSSTSISSEALWRMVKPLCHEIKSEAAVLIFDDSIEEKEYTDSSELISWHFDHTKGRSVKWVNFMTALYYSNDMSLPIGIEFVKKTKAYIDKKGK